MRHRRPLFCRIVWCMRGGGGDWRLVIGAHEEHAVLVCASGGFHRATLARAGGSGVFRRKEAKANGSEARRVGDAVPLCFQGAGGGGRSLEDRAAVLHRHQGRAALRRHQTVRRRHLRFDAFQAAARAGTRRPYLASRLRRGAAARGVPPHTARRGLCSRVGGAARVGRAGVRRGRAVRRRRAALACAMLECAAARYNRNGVLCGTAPLAERCPLRAWCFT